MGRVCSQERWVSRAVGSCLQTYYFGSELWSKRAGAQRTRPAEKQAGWRIMFSGRSKRRKKLYIYEGFGASSFCDGAGEVVLWEGVEVGKETEGCSGFPSRSGFRKRSAGRSKQWKSPNIYTTYTTLPHTVFSLSNSTRQRNVHLSIHLIYSCSARKSVGSTVNLAFRLLCFEVIIQACFCIRPYLSMYCLFSIVVFFAISILGYQLSPTFAAVRKSKMLVKGKEKMAILNSSIGPR